MARRNNNDNDNNFSVFGSNENIQDMSKRAEKIAKETTDHIFSYIDNKTKRMSQNLKDEFKDTKSLVERAVEARDKHNKETDSGASWKERAISNIISQSGRGQKFDTSWSKVGQVVGEQVVKVLQAGFAVYIGNPVKSAIRDMSSAYESNFTELAGRMGMNQQNTYSLMRDTVKTLNDSYAKSAINANKELIPELNKVASMGWKGSEAIHTALTNAVDHKIMPWLDTTSEAWNNLQFNLSDNQLKTLKSQQLLLQETQSGNRLLQSGVINSLTNDLAPLLANIDYNTLNIENLPQEAQNMMNTLVDEYNYSPQEAYQMYSEALKVYKDPLSALDRGDYSGVMQFQAAYNGGTPSDILSSDVYGRYLAASMGMNSPFVVKGLGVSNITGSSRAEDVLRDAEARNAMKGTNLSTNVPTSIYEEIASNVGEKVTKTTAWDNMIQNETTERAYVANNITHGVDMLEEIAKSVSNILKAMVFMGAGKLATRAINSKFASTSGDLAKSLLVGGDGGFSRASWIGEEASVYGKSAGKFLGKFQLSQGGFGAEGLKSGGLVGGLAQGGASMTGLTGSAGVAAGAGIGLAGLGLGVANAKDAYKDFKQGNVGGGLVSAAGAAGGSVAALGALGVVSGPVGWAGLAVAGSVLLGKKLYQLSKDADTTAKAFRDNSESMTKSYIEEQKTRKASIQSIAEALTDGEVTMKDETDARNLLVNAGLLTNAEAQEANSDQLTKLTVAYLNATKDFETKADKSAGKKLNKWGEKEIEKQNDKIQDLIYDDLIPELTEDQIKAYKADNATKGWSKKTMEINLAKASGDFKIDYEDKGKSLIDTLNTLINDNGDASTKESWSKLYDSASTSGMKVSDIRMYYGLINRGSTLSSKVAAAKLNGLDIGSIRDEIDIGDARNTYQQTLKNIRDLYQTANRGTDGSLPDGTKSTLVGYFNTLAETQIDQSTKDDVKKDYPDASTAYNIVKTDENYKSELPEKWAVGTPYVKADQIAQIHKGEAIIPAAENTTRLRKLFGIEEKASDQAQISSTDIVNAIMSQTDSLKAAIKEVVNNLQSSPSGISYATRTVGRDLSSMTPQYGNTRPVQP